MIPTTPETPDLDQLNAVSFNGNGYLDLDNKLLDYAKGRQVVIKIELSTIDPQGMLFWQGKNDREMSNYIALGIDNKHVSNNRESSRVAVCSIVYGLNFSRYLIGIYNGMYNAHIHLLEYTGRGRQ